MSIYKNNNDAWKEKVCVSALNRLGRDEPAEQVLEVFRYSILVTILGPWPRLGKDNAHALSYVESVEG